MTTTMVKAILRLTIAPTFGIGPGEKTRIDILEGSGDDYLLNLTEWNGYGEKTTTKKPIPTVKAEELIGTLTASVVPTLPLGSDVCDGSIITLELNYWGVRSMLSWNAVSPDGWDVLADVADQLCSLAGLEE